MQMAALLYLSCHTVTCYDTFSVTPCVVPLDYSCALHYLSQHIHPFMPSFLMPFNKEGVAENSLHVLGSSVTPTNAPAFSAKHSLHRAFPLRCAADHRG